MSRLPFRSLRSLTCKAAPAGAYRRLSNYRLADVFNRASTGKWMKAYEDFVGLTEVKIAQGRVIEAEKSFLDVQEVRRQKNQSLSLIQSKLKSISLELEKTNRTEDRYLALLTEEHSILREESSLTSQIVQLEKSEREYFSFLSAALRESHEKERSQAERTKYWSVIGSIVGALLGIVGTTINNYLRMSELRHIVSESTRDGEKHRSLTQTMFDAMRNQLSQTESFVSELRAVLLAESNGKSGKFSPLSESPSVQLASNSLKASQKLEEKTTELLTSVKNQEAMFSSEMKKIRSLLQKSKVNDCDTNIVYIGPEMDELLKSNNYELEQKLKLQSLATVTMIYGVLVLTLPVVYYIFKGSG